MRRSGQLRVLIADDHPVYRDGIAHAVDARTDMRIVAECDNGDEALARITELAPDVAVLDVRMPGLPTVRIIQRIAAGQIPTAVLILSAFHDADVVTQMLEAGASGYLVKDTDRHSICSAIRRVAHGETVISSDAQADVVALLRANRAREQAQLTEREHRCLELLAEGLSSSDIAAQLFVSQSTIKTHLHHVYDKLGVTGSTAAVAEAMRRGLIR